MQRGLREIHSDCWGCCPPVPVEIDSRSRELRQYLEQALEPDDVTPTIIVYCLGSQTDASPSSSPSSRRVKDRLPLIRISCRMPCWVVQMNGVTDPCSLGHAQGGLEGGGTYLGDSRLPLMGLCVRSRIRIAQRTTTSLSTCCALRHPRWDIVSGVKLGLVALEQGRLVLSLQG